MTIQQIYDKIPPEYRDEEVVFSDGDKFFLLHEHNISVVNGIVDIVLSEDRDEETDLNFN
jgi:hypothetical protein